MSGGKTEAIEAEARDLSSGASSLPSFSSPSSPSSLCRRSHTRMDESEKPQMTRLPSGDNSDEVRLRGGR